MAELDFVSQHMHDKGELNLCRSDRDECNVQAYICVSIIYMYVAYVCICLIVLSIFKI